jgi:hypothetical protein
VDLIGELAVVPDPACIADAVEHATNIREVTFELHFGIRLGEPATDWVLELPKWISRFNKLARLEFVLTGLSWDQYEKQKEVAEGIVGLVSTRIGAKVRSHRGASALNVRCGELEIQEKAWEWVAEKGKVIDCSKLVCEE